MKTIWFQLLTLSETIPIGRFLDFLIKSGNYEDYMVKVINAFNPSAVSSVMCRNTISIDWHETFMTMISIKCLD